MKLKPTLQTLVKALVLVIIAFGGTYTSMKLAPHDWAFIVGVITGVLGSVYCYIVSWE